jgi:hypothetical protein
LQPGNFYYLATATDGDSHRNYVFLLFDHLYAALSFEIRVHGEYAALRTIKLKDLSMQAFTDGGTAAKKMKATITLRANTTGTSPIESIVFTKLDSEAAASSFFSDARGQELGTDSRTFDAYYMPEDVTELMLTSTYDVYDKKNNLIRRNCTATNSLNIHEWFSEQTIKRGYKNTITLTIQPTYLYVLSDPDLDNPTVTIN